MNKRNLPGQLRQHSWSKPRAALTASQFRTGVARLEANGNDAIFSPETYLNDDRIMAAQRQALATQIGGRQGNYILRKMAGIAKRKRCNGSIFMP